ncbi:MAG: DUF4236 domain-containing protein [Proteobacteria bacterium]|nr:DUF4236 domain-containing protein [Pseudomonadota bacterium]
MGFRFRKRIRIAPGLGINLSKSGASVSVGGRGAMLNFGRRGKRVTIGVPGTGVSYSEQIGTNPHQAHDQVPPRGNLFSRLVGWMLFAVVVVLALLWLLGLIVGNT